MSDGDRETSVAFDLIARLGIKDGVVPLHAAHSGVWVRVLDEHWTIAVNGHKEGKEHLGVRVPPFHCYVEYNGWPVGVFSPYGGWIAAGGAVNEAALIEVLTTALEEPLASG